MPKLPMVRTLSYALLRISFELYRCFVSPGIHRMQRRSQLRWRQHLRVDTKAMVKSISSLILSQALIQLVRFKVNGKGTGGYSLSALTFLAFICFYWNVILPFLLCCFKFTKLQPEANQNGVEAPFRSGSVSTPGLPASGETALRQSVHFIGQDSLRKSMGKP